MAYLVGLAQHTPEEARGDPSVTYHLTPQEKRDFVDRLDSGEYDPLECVREHAGGENYISPDENNTTYKVGKDKVFGHAYEGFVDDHDNLYLISSLKYTHPDTDYINKVLDRHTDKAGQEPVATGKKSRIGYSLGTDAVRQRKGPIVEKSVAHLGITEDPLYHDDGHTRIFYRTSSARDLDNYLRETILDKKGFYVPKKTQRRLRDAANIQRHTVGASAGSDSDLVTSGLLEPLPGVSPVPSVSNASNMSSDPMDTKPAETPVAPQTNASTPPPSSQTNSEASSDRARVSSEYQKTIEQAAKFVETPGLTDMSKDEAVDRFTQIHEYRKKLENYQEQLGLFSSKQTPVEKNLLMKLNNFEADMFGKVEQEIKETNILHESQKAMHILGARTDPLLNTQTLLSVHANAIGMSNQKEAQRKLTEELADSRRTADLAQKKATDDMALAQKKANEELAELRRLNESLTSRMEKKPAQETASYQSLPGSDASGSLLKRNRDEGQGSSSAAPSTPAGKGAIVNGIELPTQRFSMGASAGTSAATLQLTGVGGNRDVPMPVSVRYRTDLGSIPPNMANSLGFNLGMPVGLSDEQAKHFVMLNEKSQALDKLALAYNEQGHHTFVSRH